MIKFEVTILGSNSAIPTRHRHPSAQLLNVHEAYYLIDCGEGCQMQLRRYGFKFQRISAIFISHLHGDHYFGLIGLINTMQLLGRSKDLHIYAPEGLEEIIQVQLNAAHTRLLFPLHIHKIPPGKGSQEIYADEHLRVSSFPLSHRIACYGFLFEEQAAERRLNKKAIEEYGIGLTDILKIKEGADFVTEEGEIIANDYLRLPPVPPRKYAYITDTRPLKSYLPIIDSCDLLYHESTFMEEARKRAKETYHSTAKQAAQSALEAKVHRLIIGHFSTRYKELKPLLKEALEIFEKTELAEEGKTFSIPRKT